MDMVMNRFQGCIPEGPTYPNLTLFLIVYDLEQKKSNSHAENWTKSRLRESDGFEPY